MNTPTLKDPATIDWLAGKTISIAESGDSREGEALRITFTDGTSLLILEICSLDGMEHGFSITEEATLNPKHHEPRR